jgi:Sulfotransferase family
MRDPLWHAVYHALCPMLDRKDVILAPRGDWPRFPCTSTLYYHDVIDIADATVLVLHKGRLPGIPKQVLRRIAKEWQWVFANEVFVVLSQSGKIRRDVRLSLDIIHCWPVIRYLHSASFRKRRSRIVYVHVPKTGGTSMWVSLARAFPSHVFYSSSHACLKNPPAPDDYDLIGLHFSPTVLSEFLSEDDWVVGMVRDPTERFLSGVVHCRRKSEDPETFTPSMKAMRNMDLVDYLATEFGRYECRLQLITFGADYRQSADGLSDREMLSSALAFARRKNVILAPSERSDEFRNVLARRLSFRPRPLGRLNSNEPAVRAAHLPALSRAIDLVNSITASEREFYDFVCRSFSALQTNAHPAENLSSARRFVGFTSRCLRPVAGIADKPH